MEHLVNSNVDFHSGWKQWLAENLIIGIREDKIANAMLLKGFEQDFIEQEIKRYKADPVVRGARKIASQNAKIASLLEILGDVFKQSEYADHFQKHDHLSGREFYDNYFYQNRPVVVKGLMKEWPALKLWNPDFFAENFGDVEVEITAERSADPFFEDNFVHHKKKISMREYVNLVTTRTDTNDFYLVAKNQLLAMDEFKILGDHFSYPEEFLDSKYKKSNYVKLWFGPKGTVTPLHHDAGNILFGQIYGRKHIKLISPFDINRVYNNRSCFSAVDLENIDYEKFPLMHLVTIIDVILEPGEFLLLPVGWWHWVKSLDVSISLSFQNFYYKNNNLIWKHAIKY